MSIFCLSYLFLYSNIYSLLVYIHSGTYFVLSNNKMFLMILSLRLCPISGETQICEGHLARKQDAQCARVQSLKIGRAHV